MNNNKGKEMEDSYEYKFSTALLIFSYLMFCVTSASHAASFNCAKAQSKVEKTICGDADLSKLDEKLAASYKASLTSHPLPSYVRARQKDWIQSNNSCDSTAILGCLKNKYMERIDHLTGTNKLTVYSNANPFSYINSDAVVEYWQQSNGQWRLSIWGGFFIHREATRENGRPMFTGCEFEGKMSDPNMQFAISEAGTRIKFKIVGNEITLDEGTEICEGFGRLPESFQRVLKE